MEFIKIDKSNYWQCVALSIDESHKHFIADNKQSLVEASFEEGLYTAVIKYIISLYQY